MKNRILILFTCLLFGQFSYHRLIAQADVIPPSPTAAGLINALEFPVDPSSGKPSISIPIYTIQRDGVFIPISLSYNAQGIKGNQVAGYAGLNWNFNTGGSVSRMVNGFPDDHAGGYMKTNTDVDYILQTCATSAGDCNSIMLNVDAKTIDVKPDVYYFDFGGYSGKFFYDQNLNQFVFQSKEDLTLEYYPTTGQIHGFKFTTPTGAQYYFGITDENDTQPILETKSTYSIIHSSIGAGSENNQTQNYNSSWPLRRIVTPNKQEITFDYQIQTQIYCSKGGEWRSEVENGFTINMSIDKHTIQQPTLDVIDFGLGTVKMLDWIHQREDYEQGTALGAIVVEDYNGSQIKKFNLDYDYYESNESAPAFVTPSMATGVNKRLRLIKVEEEGKTSGNKLPPYVLEYSSDYLPSQYNTGLDYWGYYNGEPNGNYLSEQNGFLPKRHVEPSKSATGILSKITYPTGGYTTFEFESNYGEVPEVDINYDLFLTYKGTNQIQRNVTLTKELDENPDNSAYWDDTNDDRYVITFEINNPVVSDIDVSVFLPAACPVGVESNDCPYLIRLNGNPITNGTESMSKAALVSGTNKLEVFPEQPIDRADEGEFAVVLKWDENPVVDDMLYYGGLRVKRISSYANDQLTEPSIRKDYEYFDGRAVTLPVLIETVPSFMVTGTNLDILCLSAATFQYPSLVGSGYEYPHYARVTEDIYRSKEILNSIDFEPYGKTVWHHDPPIQPNNSFSEHPYPPPNDVQFQSNKLKAKDYYDPTKRIKREDYTYLVEDQEVFAQNYVIGIEGFRNLVCSGNMDPNSIRIPESYKLYHGLDKQKSVVVNTYDGSIDLTTTTDYEYTSSNHSQLTRQIQSRSDGLNSVVEYKYPEDYTYVDGSTIDKMVKANMVAIPIETIQKVSGLVTMASATKYVEYNSFLVPGEFYAFETSTPGIGFTPSANGESFSAFTKKSEILKRDNKGNIMEVSKENDLHTVYLWGYNQTYPVAKIDNATFADVHTIFGWEYHAGTDGLGADDATLRSAPSLQNTFITTYTYDPGIGMTSQTDPNGRTTYYEYDNFGRLNVIKDHDGNVIQKNEYNYKLNSGQ